MKIHKLFAMLAIAAATMTTTSCFDEDNPDYTVQVEDIEILSQRLTDTGATLSLGSTMQLTVVLTPSTTTEQDVYFYSSDTSVATVSQTGLVETVGKGTCTIEVFSIDNPAVSYAFTLDVVDQVLDIYDYDRVNQKEAESRKR